MHITIGTLVQLDTDPCLKGRITNIIDQQVWINGAVSPYPLDRWVISE